MIPIPEEDLPKMRRACQTAARILQYVGSHVKAGVTTDELDKICEEYTQSLGATSACLGYHGYPKSVCISVNDCICHGLPGDYVLKDGDIANVDVTCIVDGYFGDTSAMFTVGEVTAEAQKLIDIAEKAMYKGIDAIGPGATTGDIGFAVNKFVTKNGYSAVKDIGGHGIGRFFHGDPFVPSYGKKGKGVRLVPGTCITVEPMVNETDADVIESGIENSTVKVYHTADGCLSAQFEHTILITEDGCEVLTRAD